MGLLLPLGKSFVFLIKDIPMLVKYLLCRRICYWYVRH